MKFKKLINVLSLMFCIIFLFSGCADKNDTSTFKQVLFGGANPQILEPPKPHIVFARYEITSDRWRVGSELYRFPANDNNGKVNIGEEIWTKVYIKNIGEGVGHNVTVRFTHKNEYFNYYPNYLSDGDELSYATISPGEEKHLGTMDFYAYAYVNGGDPPPIGYIYNFSLDIKSYGGSEGSWTDTFSITVQ